MKKTLLLSLLLSGGLCQAQNISINDVDAHIGNVPGRLFMNSVTGGSAGYEVPKGTGLHTIFAASLWCAAVDDTGALHVAAMRFGQSGADFFAGPYSTTDDYLDPNYVSEYGTSTWFVLKGEVQNHIANYAQLGYVMPSNIADWPGNGINSVGVATNLAPFVDNNNNGIYEPTLGEYPDIRGDQACYLIMNDVAAPHTETGGMPLGIEVHTMIYQYVTTDYLNRTTFLNYRIFNRGNNDYSNFKVSLWSDFDLGNGSDDYIGCDVTNNMMYIYNSFNNDSGPNGYGLNPPAAGISSLNKTMKHFTYFTNGAAFPFTDPSTAMQYYNYMQGKWANGSDMFFGGTGATGTIPASYMFPGDSDPTHIGTAGIDPGTTWDEASSVNPSGDRRGVMIVEDAVLNAGDNECYDFAVLYSREPGNDNMQNVTSLRTQAALAKMEFDSGYDGTVNYNCDQVTLGIDQLDEAQIGLFPNPTSGKLTLSFGDIQLTGSVVVVQDLSGRIVFENRIDNSSEMKIEMKEKSGVYLLSILTEKGRINKKVVIQ